MKVEQVAENGKWVVLKDEEATRNISKLDNSANVDA